MTDDKTEWFAGPSAKTDDLSEMIMATATGIARALRKGDPTIPLSMAGGYLTGPDGKHVGLMLVALSETDQLCLMAFMKHYGRIKGE